MMKVIEKAIAVFDDQTQLLYLCCKKSMSWKSSTENIADIPASSVDEGDEDLPWTSSIENTVSISGNSVEISSVENTITISGSSVDAAEELETTVINYLRCHGLLAHCIPNRVFKLHHIPLTKHGLHCTMSLAYIILIVQIFLANIR